jgi:multidrug resistance efflux pump
MVQVASQASGVIRSVAVDVGDEVFQGQAVAIVTLPTGAAGASQFTVRAPIDGVVVARQSHPGDIASSSRTILTLVDPSSLWVEAFIDHGQLSRLRTGQPVEVWVPSLGRTVQGYVATVGRASASTASQLARTNSPGSVQAQSPSQAASVPPGASYVPVRIDLDYDNAPLVVGSAVSVKVRL